MRDQRLKSCIMATEAIEKSLMDLESCSLEKVIIKRRNTLEVDFRIRSYDSNVLGIEDLSGSGGQFRWPTETGR